MKWKIINELNIKSSKLKNGGVKESFDVEGVVGMLLRNRGLTTEKEREEFLSPEDPMGDGFRGKLVKGELKRGLERAVKRVVQAIEAGEEIVVYGDYDADGICGTAILWETLNEIGARVLPYIPERFTEGYGLNVESVKRLKEERPGMNLVITVDHGIVAGERIESLKGLVDVVVTDHHQPSEASFEKLGKVACAVVYTTKLSGSGVSWLLAYALWQEASSKKWGRVMGVDLREKLGLVAIGTVADLLPLLGVNRSLVKWGLAALRKTNRPGIRYLCEKIGIKQSEIDTYQIGFMLAPRLNAMGRMEHAMESLRLVCTRRNERALGLAEKLQNVNRERQRVLDETVERAKMVWGKRKEKLIFIADESFHEGVIGLVAGRLVEEYWLPAIIVSKGERYSKASARSIVGLNMIEFIREAGELLVDAGGHPMAAGFTVETAKLGELAKFLTEKAEEKLTEDLLERVLTIDAEISLASLSEVLWSELSKMAPFGLGNPQPVFETRDVEVVGVKLVGREGQHLKLELRQGGARGKVNYEAIWFGVGERYAEFLRGQVVDVAYNLVANEWGGERRLELRLKDVRWKEESQRA